MVDGVGAVFSSNITLNTRKLKRIDMNLRKFSIELEENKNL